MTITLDGREIFLASPSGLESERELVGDIVDKFNRSHAIPAGVAFIARGWEEVAPGIGRPQSQINELLKPCDFLIVLLADHWGSSPGGGKYGSGTEEEFMKAIALRASEDANMRDIHVFFRSIPPDRLSDPGPELDRVLAFKQKLQDSKQILYTTFDSSDSLRLKVEGSLRKWVQPLDPRSAVVITLNDPDPMPAIPTDEILDNALALAEQGSLVRAEVLFARASEANDPRAVIEFAKFTRRQGRLDDAKKLNLNVVSILEHRGTPSAEESAYLVDALANIGVIDRKKGDLNHSVQALREAIRVAEDSPTPLPQQLAYALDNLGHSFSQLNRYEDARAAFQKSNEIRDVEGGTIEERNISRMNLGWLELRIGSPTTALSFFEDAEAVARAGSGALSLASALTGRAKALMNMGQAKEALEPLTEALEINRTAGASDGISIVSGLLARSYASLGNQDAADVAIATVLRESDLSGNVIGSATARWAQALVSRARGDMTAAISWFEHALELARSTGNAALVRSIEVSYSRSDDA